MRLNLNRMHAIYRVIYSKATVPDNINLNYVINNQ